MLAQGMLRDVPYCQDAVMPLGRAAVAQDNARFTDVVPATGGGHVKVHGGLERHVLTFGHALPVKT